MTITSIVFALGLLCTFAYAAASQDEETMKMEFYYFDYFKRLTGFIIAVNIQKI